MKKNNLQFISDINDAIDWILNDYVKGVSHTDFANNHEKVDAVIRQIAVIGEAMNGMESEFLMQHPELPSKDAVAMRKYWPTPPDFENAKQQPSDHFRDVTKTILSGKGAQKSILV